MRASAPVISVALPSSGVLDPKQILYICTLTYSSTPKSSTGEKKKRKEKKKSSQSQGQAALQQHELYKTCAFAASEIKMHRFKGTYINLARTYYCQSTIVADFWSSILLLMLLLITVCQLGLKSEERARVQVQVQILQSSDHGTIDLG
jgi:hypothetical protein